MRNLLVLGINLLAFGTKKIEMMIVFQSIVAFVLMPQARKIEKQHG